MRPMKPDKEISVSTIRIPTASGSIPALVLAPKTGAENVVGVLWIHGGGYIAGMKEMVPASRAVDLVKKVRRGGRFPRLSAGGSAPLSCRGRGLLFGADLYEKPCPEAGIRRDQIMVGGESAGGGLCAAVCLMARDRASVNIAFQMPLYPMLDDRDTESSRDNHGQVWNTRKNHIAWKLYLRGTPEGACPRLCRPGKGAGRFRSAACLYLCGGRRTFLCGDASLHRSAEKRGDSRRCGRLPHRHPRL